MTLCDLAIHCLFYPDYLVYKVITPLFHLLDSPAILSVDNPISIRKIILNRRDKLDEGGSFVTIQKEILPLGENKLGYFR